MDIQKSELKQKATKLRKEKNYEKALAVYRGLWQNGGDKFDGVGLLHCLRKVRNFEEAIPLANDLVSKHSGFEWCRNEVIWTYIQGEILGCSDKEPIQNIINQANKILQLNPDEIAINTIAFRVAKLAHSVNRWDVVSQWITKIDPKRLNDKGTINETGREGWSAQSRWYHYRARSLIEEGNSDAAIKLLNEALERFPRQRKFFLRLKALGLSTLGDSQESEKIYKELCISPRPDWWILHDYGKLLIGYGREDESLAILCKAAIANPSLKSSVSLLCDLGGLYQKLGKYEIARAHLLLCKYVRTEQGWNITSQLQDTINHLNTCIHGTPEPSSVKDALSICKNEWYRVLGASNVDNVVTSDRKPIRRIKGKVDLGIDEKPFCFIETEDKRSIFCIKLNLPPKVQNGDVVVFDAIPSFDRKKNIESWKAANIYLHK